MVSSSLPSLQCSVCQGAGAEDSPGDATCREGLGLLQGSEGEVFSPPSTTGSLPRRRAGDLENQALSSPRGWYATPEQNCQAWARRGEGNEPLLITVLA